MWMWVVVDFMCWGCGVGKWLMFVFVDVVDCWWGYVWFEFDVYVDYVFVIVFY